MIRLSCIHAPNPASLNDHDLPEAFPRSYSLGTHISPSQKKSQPKSFTIFHTNRRRFQLARSMACLNSTFNGASDPTNPFSMWNQNQNGLSL
jgi:hypothetical protein